MQKKQKLGTDDWTNQASRACAGHVRRSCPDSAIAWPPPQQPQHPGPRPPRRLARRPPAHVRGRRVASVTIAQRARRRTPRCGAGDGVRVERAVAEGERDRCARAIASMPACPAATPMVKRQSSAARRPRAIKRYCCFVFVLICPWTWLIRHVTGLLPPM